MIEVGHLGEGGVDFVAVEHVVGGVAQPVDGDQRAAGIERGDRPGGEAVQQSSRAK